MVNHSSLRPLTLRYATFSAKQNGALGSSVTSPDRSHLCVAWGLKKICYLTFGNDKLLVCVDRKPLLKVFGERQLRDKDNPRVPNFKEKMLHWRFSVAHVQGKDHHVADVMS